MATDRKVMLDSRLIAYLPILTTLVAAGFFAALVRRYLKKGSGIHLVWWAAGVFTYGAGTGLESLITLFGNSVALNKLWYVMGALLGAYPLAQGTVYLLVSRKTANRLTSVTLPFVLILAALVLCSPADLEKLDPEAPSGRILAWHWLRWLTPVINLYAAGFLIGGAVWSSIRYFARKTMKHRAIGNALIAAGAILPGIGGVAAKSGSVELLYITELIGLILIWAGYQSCLLPDASPPSSNDRT